MRYRPKTAFGVFAVTGLIMFWGCTQPGPGNENENVNVNVNVNENGGWDNQPALRSQNIDFELIGIHDPDSDNFDSNCTASGCHGDRTHEVASDGATPAAHGTMLTQFGEGNDRCLNCHDPGPNFLTGSAGSLRKQVDVEAGNCALCHGKTPVGDATSFYDQ